METITTKFSIYTLLKNFSYIGASLLSLNIESYSILGIFMIVDTVTGVARSGTIHGWRSITSHVMTVGILAKCMVLLVPFLLSLAGHAIGVEVAFIAKSALNVLIISELYSILSNIQSIRLGREVQEFDAVNYLLTKLRDTLERYVKKPHDNK